MSAFLLCSNGLPHHDFQHRHAFKEASNNYQVVLCFAFPYSFQFLVSVITEWLPHWAPVCLWYSFLVQMFCGSASGKEKELEQGAEGNETGSGGTAVFRLLLPLGFLAEGVSGRSYLLDLNGTELLLVSFLLAVRYALWSWSDPSANSTL